MTDSFCISSTGGRSHNEDSFVGFKARGMQGFAVCDGLGGLRHGEEASLAVCRALQEAFEGCDADNCDADGLIARGLTAAEQRLAALQMAAGDRQAYKSTVAALVLSQGIAHIAHCGDTRVYHFSDGKYVWRTKDHSLAQMLVLAGEIKENEIRSSQESGVLLHAMGASTEDFLFEGIRRALAGIASDAFIICTDGFWQHITGAEMEEALETQLQSRAPSAEGWLDSLCAKLGDTDKNDNFTAYAVIVTKED